MHKFINKNTEILIRWFVLMGSSFAFVFLLLTQEWLIALLLFPVMVIVVAWATFQHSFLSKIQSYAQAFGEHIANIFVTWLKAIALAIEWKLAGVEGKYLILQKDVVKDFTTEGLKSSLKIFTPLLNEIFVPLDLSNSFIRKFNRESLHQYSGFQWDDITIKLAEKDGLRIWDILKETKKIEAYRSLAVLAWGGAGKTTLLRHITYIYTHKKEKLYQAPKLLPVLILLREWQTTIVTVDKINLPTLIEEHYIPNLPKGNKLKLPPNWVENHLKKGKMLIMFDGFDEVKDDWQYLISKWLGKEMKNYPKTCFILTSRPSGYQNFSPEDKMKAELFVKAFNPNQQERFINNWYWLQERDARGARNSIKEKEVARNKPNNLLRQLEKSPELDDLAQSPLLLNIITNLYCHSPTKTLPKKRSDLYREVVSLQLESRPLAKNISLMLPPDKTQQVLQDLALYMVEKNQAVIEYNLLIQEVKKSVKSFKRFADVKNFIEQIVDVTELIVERDENYEFAHLSFQSYLAAINIKETRQEDKLLENYQKPWWKETILFYSSFLNPTRLIPSLIKINTRESIALAYKCIKETPRKVNQEVEEELADFEEEVSSLLFKHLEKYLENQKWKKADQETTKLMLWLGDKDEKGYLNNEDCLNFPQEELQIIDQLWLKYSDGKFGFSVQKQIWLDLGGKIDEYNYEIYQKFGDRIGWRKNNNWLSYSKLTFNTTAREGHLPRILWGGLKGWEAWLEEVGISLIFSRL